MPEAVIVSTARSPIGRAVKGSLKDMRPDDLAVQMVQAALAKVPELDPAEIGRPDPGRAASRRESPGNNLGRAVAVLAGWTTCPVSPSTATAPAACRPPGWPSTRSRRARVTSSSRPASRR